MSKNFFHLIYCFFQLCNLIKCGDNFPKQARITRHKIFQHNKFIYYFRHFMPSNNLSEKKLKKIARINDAVAAYFIAHPAIDKIGATLLMPLFIRKGIFLKDTENGLPVRVILRELYKTDQLFLLKDTVVMIDKRSYYFFRK